MVWGPCWKESDGQSNRDQSQESYDDLRPLIRSIAEEFVTGLQEAKTITTNWRDQRLGYALVESIYSRTLAQLADTHVWGRANEGLSQEFWKIAGAELQVGWLQERARSKPRGYAGDYELMIRMCEQIACKDPLGGLFDQFFLAQAAPQAVLARNQQIARAVATHRMSRGSKPYKIVSVGSGPAIDVRSAVQLLPVEYRRDLEIVLLDMDQEGLDHAERHFKGLVHPNQLTCLRDNLFRLPKKRKSAELLKSCDFLICSGLFDYLPFDSAREMLSLFWKSLASGGTLLFGNFAPQCPTRALMEWVGNWYLLYRTSDEMMELGASAGIPEHHYQVRAERFGIDLFLCAAVPEAAKFLQGPYYQRRESIRQRKTL